MTVKANTTTNMMMGMCMCFMRMSSCIPSAKVLSFK